MWWEPRSEEEYRLFGAVDRLYDQYRARLPEDNYPVMGIGAGTPTPELGFRDQRLMQYWAPLLLVDDRFAPDVPLVRTRVADLLEGPDTGRRSHPEESSVQDLISNWGLDPDVLIEAVGPILPAVSVGSQLHARGVGTVGLPVTINGSYASAADGFLTVAHAVGPVGSSVTVDLPSGGRAIGSVALHEESARNPRIGGDDIALVDLGSRALQAWLANSGPHVPSSGPPYPIEPVDLYASQSGAVMGQVTAAIRQMGDATWQWLDCWELGGTAPTMQHGDSGSVAIEPGASPGVFGHFVGGAPSLRGNGFTHHWVQDLSQVLHRNPQLASMIRF